MNDATHTTMTPVRLRECMEAVCWGTATTAEVLGLRRQTVQRMLSGQYEIPPYVADYMEAVGQWFAAHPFTRPSPNDPGWRDRLLKEEF